MGQRVQQSICPLSSAVIEKPPLEISLPTLNVVVGPQSVVWRRSLCSRPHWSMLPVVRPSDGTVGHPFRVVAVIVFIMVLFIVKLFLRDCCRQLGNSSTAYLRAAFSSSGTDRFIYRLAFLVNSCKSCQWLKMTTGFADHGSRPA